MTRPGIDIIVINLSEFLKFKHFYQFVFFHFIFFPMYFNTGTGKKKSDEKNINNI